MSRYESFWCSGFQWLSLWRSDKFLLTLSVYNLYSMPASGVSDRNGLISLSRWQRQRSFPSLKLHLGINSAGVITGLRYWSDYIELSIMRFVVAQKRKKKQNTAKIFSIDLLVGGGGLPSEEVWSKEETYNAFQIHGKHERLFLASCLTDVCHPFSVTLHYRITFALNSSRLTLYSKHL